MGRRRARASRRDRGGRGGGPALRRRRGGHHQLRHLPGHGALRRSRLAARRAGRSARFGRGARCPAHAGVDGVWRRERRTRGRPDGGDRHDRRHRRGGRPASPGCGAGVPPRHAHPHGRRCPDRARRLCFEGWQRSVAHPLATRPCAHPGRGAGRAGVCGRLTGPPARVHLGPWRHRRPSSAVRRRRAVAARPGVPGSGQMVRTGGAEVWSRGVEVCRSVSPAHLHTSR